MQVQYRSKYFKFVCRTLEIQFCLWDTGPKIMSVGQWSWFNVIDKFKLLQCPIDKFTFKVSLLRDTLPQLNMLFLPFGRYKIGDITHGSTKTIGPRILNFSCSGLVGMDEASECLVRILTKEGYMFSPNKPKIVLGRVSKASGALRVCRFCFSGSESRSCEGSYKDAFRVYEEHH